MRQAWGIVKLAPMGGESDETACRKARELAILALDAYRGSVYEGWCQLTLGLSEYRLGELDAARVCLGTLLQLEDAATARRDASAYVRQPCASAALALVHHALGQDEEARAMLDETLARMRRLLAEELPTQHIDDPLKHYPDQDSIALYEEAKRAIEGQ